MSDDIGNQQQSNNDKCKKSDTKFLLISVAFKTFSKHNLSVDSQS